VKGGGNMTRRTTAAVLYLKWRWLVFRDLEALHDLGAWYGSGDIAHLDKEIAIRAAKKYYRMAAEKGHAESAYEMGVIAYAGEDGGQNIKEAVYWFQIASRQGWEDASQMLEAIN